MTTADDARSLAYFWEDKGDVKRWVRFEEWARTNLAQALELERLISDRDWANKRIALFLEDLVEKAEAEEDEG